MQQDTDLFPHLAAQSILQAIGKPPSAVLVTLAAEQVQQYARHMRQLSAVEKHPNAADIVASMPDDSRRLLVRQVIEWSKKECPEEMAFVPPWGLIEELCEELIRAGESA